MSRARDQIHVMVLCPRCRVVVETLRQSTVSRERSGTHTRDKGMNESFSGIVIVDFDSHAVVWG